MDPASSFRTMFLNIVNALLGVSIFAMPWGFLMSGLLGGFFILFFVGYLSYDTAKILLDAQRTLYYRSGKVFGYPEIAACALGESFGTVIKIATCISCLGGCTGYLIFLGEVCGQLFAISFSTVSFSLMILKFMLLSLAL